MKYKRTLYMVRSEANVWPNFSYGYCNNYPCGWLLNQDRSSLILFSKNKNSSINDFRIIIKMYFANDFGEPISVKSASQITLDYAWDKWHDLQVEGWTFEELELPD